MLPFYFAYLTIPIALFGTILYIKDTLTGKARPNKISWIFWTSAPFVGVYVAYQSGVAVPYLISIFMSGFTPLLVVIASFFNKNSYWKTTTFDIMCGVISAIAIIIWITTKNGFVSLSFAILADVVAGIPTIIKSWKYSDSETLAPYMASIVNQTIVLLIIVDFNFLNSGFPIYLILLNILIVLGIKKKLFL